MQFAWIPIEGSVAAHRTGLVFNAIADPPRYVSPFLGFEVILNSLMFVNPPLHFIYPRITRAAHVLVFSRTLAHNAIY